MTNDELKTALLSGKPVYHQCKYADKPSPYIVSGIVYRKDIKGKIKISVELQNISGNKSILIVSPRALKKEVPNEIA
ncbi:MAG: hypothetical protein J1E39_02065 [Eubacterium sp.]|nr:hypothetical protein [Eubacterium sp.]